MINIKKETAIFNFFRIRHSLLLTSEDISEIVKEVSNNGIDIVEKINRRINYYRFVNIILVLLILLLGNSKRVYYGIAFYCLLNVGILIYQIVKDKLKKYEH